MTAADRPPHPLVRIRICEGNRRRRDFDCTTQSIRPFAPACSS